MRWLTIILYCIYSVLVQTALYHHLLVCNGYNDSYFVISGHLSYILHCFFTMNVLNFLYPPFEFFVDWLAIVFGCLICTVGTFTSVRCTLLFVVLVCAHFHVGMRTFSVLITWCDVGCLLCCKIQMFIPVSKCTLYIFARHFCRVSCVFVWCGPRFHLPLLFCLEVICVQLRF